MSAWMAWPPKLSKSTRRYGAFATLSVALLGLTVAASPQTPDSLAIAPDSSRWELEGNAKVTQFQGRSSLFLNGGAATVKKFEMRDGIVDVDVATTATRDLLAFNFE